MELIYNVVLISTVQQRDSLHVYASFIVFFSIMVFHKIQFPVLYSRTWLFIRSLCHSLLIPNSQSFPPPPPNVCLLSRDSEKGVLFHLIPLLLTLPPLLYGIHPLIHSLFSSLRCLWRERGLLFKTPVVSYLWIPAYVSNTCFLLLASAFTPFKNKL